MALSVCDHVLVVQDWYRLVSVNEKAPDPYRVHHGASQLQLQQMAASDGLLMALPVEG